MFLVSKGVTVNENLVKDAIISLYIKQNFAICICDWQLRILKYLYKCVNIILYIKIKQVSYVLSTTLGQGV